eukprot:1516263-Amphidinium_carterae.1
MYRPMTGARTYTPSKRAAVHFATLEVRAIGVQGEQPQAQAQGHPGSALLNHSASRAESQKHQV